MKLSENQKAIDAVAIKMANFFLTATQEQAAQVLKLHAIYVLQAAEEANNCKEDRLLKQIELIKKSKDVAPEYRAGYIAGVEFAMEIKEE